VFDGSSATPTFSTKYCHGGGGLGFYKGNPTTVGCGNLYEWSAYRKTETLTETGWVQLPDHPWREPDLNGNPSDVAWHSLIGLPSGAMLLIGHKTRLLSHIWRLRDDEWSLAGHLKRVRMKNIFPINIFL
jgi:hypothetical protein